MNDLFQRLGGCCPHCGKSVNIVEGMVYDYTLDKQGNPHFLNSEQYRVAGYCKNCSRSLYVAPNDNGGYTVYPDNDAIPMFLLQACADRGKRSSVLAIRLLEKEDNPFVNAVDDYDWELS